MQVIAALEAAAGDCDARGEALVVLLDSAPAEGSFLRLQQWGIEFESLFGGSPEASLLEVAPLLFDATAVSAEVRPALWSWLQSLAYAYPCLSWFRTKRAIGQVATHLKRFHLVNVSEEQTMLMRWYDTRILPIWLTCLAADQSAAFMVHSAQWQYVDRFGEVVTHSAAEQPVDAGWPGSNAFGKPLITLNDAQFALLVGAADLDVLLGHLRRIIPDELALVESKRLTTFVGRHQKQAIDYGLRDIDRQTQFVILALYTSGQALERPEFEAYMKNPPAAPKAFADGLQALPDTVWNAGAPLWESTSVKSGAAAHG
jgi:hypothetical protein